MRDILELGVGATFIRFELGLGLDLVRNLWSSPGSCYLVARLVIPSRWDPLGVHDRWMENKWLEGLKGLRPTCSPG